MNQALNINFRIVIWNLGFLKSYLNELQDIRAWVFSLLFDFKPMDTFIFGYWQYMWNIFSALLSLEKKPLHLKIAIYHIAEQCRLLFFGIFLILVICVS